MLAVKAKTYGSGKFHLAGNRQAVALCGAESGCKPHSWLCAAEAKDVREYAPEQLCARCLGQVRDE